MSTLEPRTDANDLNVVVAVLGGFMALYGLIAVKIKTAWYLGEALPAMLVGILLGPYLADLLNATRWAVPPAPNQLDEIALGVMRIMIAIQLMTVCLVPIMIIMWFCTSGCILATMPDLPFLSALVIGACVTSTDPILSQAIAKGAFAERYVPARLREQISAEAGANDGFASPFLMLAINLMTSRPAGEQGVGIAMGNWFIGTLVYFVLLAVAVGAVAGTLARFAVEFALSRKWINTEGYLLFPTALGLFIVGCCGAMGTSDLLARFTAGCALNWDGRFLAESVRRHDEVNSSVDAILNLGGFMYIGTVLPWHDGITYPRLLALSFMVLLLRRIPALLLMYRAMPRVVRSWREAVFMGYFGPIGVGAVYYLQSTRHVYFDPDLSDPASRKLLEALSPIVYFLVFFSIVVHGLSIPLLNLMYWYFDVQPVEGGMPRLAAGEAT
ncbi:Cation/H+ exchanger [Microdochium trichocladiopsis]|uniref:Cation/H+ exchanger n=1 Tax=Microdochium trichocladiopsis TaxID=1682393 RepID=A0A9P8YKX0_9PEZI|nr:Cation/H+ exchanger [Microdochium trichocladiopsis]KAH7041401.1 Cation/H+ exchanger [Microdochium trichocladiopsis]